MGPVEQFDTEGETRSLPARYYTESAVLQEEKERLFYRTWQYACHTSALPETGSYVMMSLFDQDIFLVRGDDDVIRAFFNVCPHRGHTLVTAQGVKQQIVCPYHSWTYMLDGRLKGARGINRENGPNRTNICLSQIRVDRILDFIFINLDDKAQPISEIAKGLDQQILDKCPDILDYRVADNDETLGHSYECEANWKGLLDNYLECYHCEAAHPTFKDMMDIPNSVFELHPNHTYECAPTAMKSKNDAFPLNLDFDITTGHFWWLYPNTVFGQFPGVPGFYISRLTPLTPDRTSRQTTSLVPANWPDPDAKRRDRLRSLWTENVVSQEDKALCEAVQRGMHQRGFEQGWYVTSPDSHNISEHAVRHFHGLYRASMD